MDKIYQMFAEAIVTEALKAMGREDLATDSNASRKGED